MGFLSGSQFNLVISLRYTPVAGEMPFWCQLLEQTSRIIHDSTDGVLSIGQVLISANSMGGKDADIWVHPNDDVWPNSSGAIHIHRNGVPGPEPVCGEACPPDQLLDAHDYLATVNALEAARLPDAPPPGDSAPGQPGLVSSKCQKRA